MKLLLIGFLFLTSTSVFAMDKYELICVASYRNPSMPSDLDTKESKKWDGNDSLDLEFEVQGRFKVSSHVVFYEGLGDFMTNQIFDKENGVSTYSMVALTPEALRALHGFVLKYNLDSTQERLKLTCFFEEL